LTREVKIYNDVYIFLQKQYFKETLQENKTVNTVQVLDPAYTPYKTSGPRLIVNTFIFGLFMFLFMVFVNIYKEKKTGLK